MYQIQFPTPSRNPQYYNDQLQLIFTQATKLSEVKEEDFTTRHIAVACDLWQRYIEIMNEIENTVEVVGDDSVVVGIKGVNLKIKNVEQIANWLEQPEPRSE